MKNRKPDTARSESKQEPKNLPLRKNPSKDVISTPQQEPKAENAQKREPAEKDLGRDEWPSVSWP
jgi:hypothetical protein